MVAKHHAHVDDFAFIVVKKGQIAGFGFVDKTEHRAEFCLLMRVAGQIAPRSLKRNLNQTAAVDAPNAATSP